MLDNKSWHVAFFSCIVFDTTSSCLVLLEIPSVGVIPDRALACLFSKQQESLDKKFFTETLFHSQVVFHYLLCYFLDQAILKVQVFSDLHL